MAASWAPQFLIFEKKHLSRIRLAESRRILKHAGYKVVNLWPDELAYRGPPNE